MHLLDVELEQGADVRMFVGKNARAAISSKHMPVNNEMKTYDVVKYGSRESYDVLIG